MTTTWLILAGGLGAVARFVVDGAVRHRIPSTVPWATFAINVTGSLLLGVLTGLVLFRGDPDTARAIAGTGFCGGYTTFSTASFETVRLAQQPLRWTALAYALGTAAASLAAAAVGLVATS